MLPSKTEKVDLKPPKIGSSITLSSSLQHQLNLTSTIFDLVQHTHFWNYRNHYRTDPMVSLSAPLLLLRKCL